MPTNAETVYLDSSALVKLVVREAESSDLEAFLAHRSIHVSCALARTEVIRAIRAREPAAVPRARQVLRRIRLVRLDDGLLDAAAEIDQLRVRTLDAIHLAAAQTLGAELDDLVTYDGRMARAAEGLGFSVVAPGTGV